ncbi:MAG: archaeal proteasome endopeptidase complex subunit alpha [Candidatus Bathyarchaeota archaeon]|nr:archaeal proteasome endopeptidase complex subunit alpha [Candidatus Bathyarchaeota archaeon]
MSIFTKPGAYDRAITIFSPDGRLFQVEYALETVKRGSIVLGIKCSEGVVLAAEEKPSSNLQDPNFTWKIFQIDEHIGAAIAGLSSDARILIDQARIYAQSNRLTYDEAADVEVLSKRVGDTEQIYTQHAGVRPFGVSIIFGGVDKIGCRIFQTDPSGAVWGYKAVAVGAGSDTVKELLEAEYRDDLSLEQVILLAIKCLSKAVEGKLEPQKIRIVIIPSDTRKFKLLTEQEVKKYIDKGK